MTSHRVAGIPIVADESVQPRLIRFRISSGRPRFQATCQVCGAYFKGQTEAAWKKADAHDCKAAA